MNNSKSKWLSYTLVVGLIPMATRLLVWITTAPGKVNALNAADFLILGLVLHASMINELEHLSVKDRDWKTLQNGSSLFFITLYNALFAITIIGEKNPDLIEANVMLSMSIIVATWSTALGFSVFHRLSKRNSR